MILDGMHPVDRAVHRWWFTAPAGDAIVAVSGGADSMALVESLRRLGSRVGRRTLTIAHLDHGLRPDSIDDAVHVMEYATVHELASIGRAEDVAQRVRDNRMSVEEAGRNARYDLFAYAARQFHAAFVLTAHTQTDHIETVMMRILRGTGEAGLAGIPSQRGVFVRPLLGVTREHTIDYCVRNDVEFLNDPSNEDTQFFRNRVRHQILPELRAVFPKIDGALLRIAARARSEQAAFADRTDEWHRALVTVDGDEAMTLRIGGFGDADDETVARFLRDVCARNGWARDVGRVHYTRLAALFRDPRPGSSADLPGFSARREHDAVVLRRASAASGPNRQPIAESTLVIPGRVQAGGWLLDTAFVSGEAARRSITTDAGGPDTVYLDADAVGERLVVRAPRPGDRMRPLGLEGHKKLSDLFIDRKVPRRCREDAILIAGQSIHWVSGLATSEESRIGPQSRRVIRLKAARA